MMYDLEIRTHNLQQQDIFMSPIERYIHRP